MKAMPYVDYLFGNETVSLISVSNPKFVLILGSEIFCKASIETRCKYPGPLAMDFICLLILDRRCQSHSDGTQ